MLTKAQKGLKSREKGSMRRDEGGNCYVYAVQGRKGGPRRKRLTSAQPPEGVAAITTIRGAYEKLSKKRKERALQTERRSRNKKLQEKGKKPRH